MIELVERNLECAGESRTYPGLGFGLAAFPPHHGRAVNAQPLCQLFLAETDRFAPGREAVALCWHYAISDLGRLLAPIGAVSAQITGARATSLRRFCVTPALSITGESRLSSRAYGVHALTSNKRTSVSTLFSEPRAGAHGCFKQVCYKLCRICGFGEMNTWNRAAVLRSVEADG